MPPWTPARAPILWTDMDGVWTDFRAAVQARFGLDCEAPDAAMGDVWPVIAANPDFWRDLPEMPDLDALWSGIRHLQPRVLSGGCNPLPACATAKEDWAREHLGDLPVIVTKARHKPEFCRPGDILIDDKAENIAAWEAAGGIGILHHSATGTLRRLAGLGLDQGWDSPAFLAQYRRRALGQRRTGTPTWVLEDDGRQALVDAFRPPLSRSGARRYRTLCARVEHASEAAHHVPRSGFARVEAVGEFVFAEAGLHVLTVTVDGRLRRDDGGVHHLVFALDDGASSGDRPDPARAAGLLAAAAPEHEDTAYLTLPAARRVTVLAHWRCADALTDDPAPKPRQAVEETVAPWVFGSGRAGQVILRRKGDMETTIYVDTSGAKHNEDGAPAIVTRFAPTGEIRFQDWYEDGQRVVPHVPPGPR